MGLEGRLVVIFPCMFSPVLDPARGEGLAEQVRAYASDGPGYFQKQCDRLHYFVTKGAGAVLPQHGPRPPARPSPAVAADDGAPSP